MPVRGIIFLAVVAFLVAVVKREEIYDLITKEFGADESADENEKENEK